MGTALEGRSAREQGQSDVGDSTQELDILEPTGTMDIANDHALNRHGLQDAPIPADWILEGSPVARVRLLSGSTDGKGSTVMWDCTAGRFNWHYDIDETVCVMQGSVVLKDADGKIHRLRDGDTFFFARGTRYEWNVSNYVRKVAFIHVPMSATMLRLRRIYKALKRIVRPTAGADGAETPTLFGGG